MPTYLAPDIYVEEVPGGARPIQAVGTSTAGFIGVAPDATAYMDRSPADRVRAINNWSEFMREFFHPDSASTPLSQAVYGFFLNGGRRCYVVNVGRDVEFKLFSRGQARDFGRVGRRRNPQRHGFR